MTYVEPYPEPGPKWVPYLLWALAVVIAVLVPRPVRSQDTTVAPAIVQLVGRGYIDTLSALAGGAVRIDTLSDYEKRHRTLGMTCPVADDPTCPGPAIYLALSRIDWYVEITSAPNGDITRTSHEVQNPVLWDEARGILAHEFGHWAEQLHPELRRLFDGASTLPASIMLLGPGDAVVRHIREEMFADAFGHAVVNRLRVGWFQPYGFSPEFMSAAQDSIIDHFVGGNHVWTQ